MNRSQARTRGPATRSAAGSGSGFAGAQERPRLAVFKSGRHIYAQVIDDAHGRDAGRTPRRSTRACARTSRSGGNRATRPGRSASLVAGRAKKAGVTKVVFDRGGYPYHGKVKALADAAREGGPGVLAWHTTGQHDEQQPGTAGAAGAREGARRAGSRARSTASCTSTASRRSSRAARTSRSRPSSSSATGRAGSATARARPRKSRMAIRKGIEMAKKSMLKVSLKGTTIPHAVHRRVRRRDACCSSRPPPERASSRAGRSGPSSSRSASRTF